MQIKKIIVGELQVNCYIVFSKNSSNAIVIDPGDDFKIINEFLEKNNLTPQYIINTHGHFDHIMANNSLKQTYPNSLLLVHKDDAPMLNDASLNLSYFIGKKFVSVKPDKLLSDNDTISWDNKELLIIHTPGHTLGGICILVENILFSGDTLFYESIGRTDLDGGSSEKLLSSIKNKLLNLSAETLVFPGHGTQTSIGYEKKHNEFL